MIHDLGKEIDAKLVAETCPLRVRSGPEPKTGGYVPERIIIEHDLGASDSFGAPKSARPNPHHRYTRSVAGKIAIYVKSPRAAAQVHEHRERAEQVLDLVLVALAESAVARKNALQIRSGRFFVPEDMSGSEVHSGAAYELQFSIDRSVQSVDWAGDAAPEVEVGGEDGIGISNTVLASVNGDETFETVIP